LPRTTPRALAALLPRPALGRRAPARHRQATPVPSAPAARHRDAGRCGHRRRPDPGGRMTPTFETPFDPPVERKEEPDPVLYRPAIGIILGVAAASIMFWMLKQGHLEHTSLVFIGIPTVLAILTVRFVPQPRTATGVILKGITLALLVSGIVLREGFICIVMASPLFLLIGVIVGKIADTNYWRRTRHG